MSIGSAAWLFYTLSYKVKEYRNSNQQGYSRKLDCCGELWELDPVDDLPVHVEGEELGGGVLLPSDAVPHPDGRPWDDIQQEKLLGISF